MILELIKNQYIEIMIYDLNYTEGEVPLFESLKPGSSDYEHVLSKIRTTNHPSESGDNVSHDEGKNRKYGEKEFKKEGSFFAKDSDINHFHSEAYRLGTNATVRNLEEEEQ